MTARRQPFRMPTPEAPPEASDYPCVWENTLGVLAGVLLLATVVLALL